MSASAVATRPAEPQYVRALARANRIRLNRAKVKQEVRTGKSSITDIIMDPPECCETMTISDLLLTQVRWGGIRVRKFLSQIPMSENKTIGSLTDRQRRTLVSMLDGSQAQPPPVPWASLAAA